MRTGSDLQYLPSASLKLTPTSCPTMLRDVTSPEPIRFVTKDVLPVERAHIYVSSPDKAPPGVQVQTGPRGGLWFDSNSVPKREGYKPTKSPKQPKGKAPKKPKEEKPPKREIGKPITSPGDLPLNIQREAPDVQDAYTKIFNDVLAKGGSEADAMAAAKKVIPDRDAKPAPVKVPPKRAIGTSFNGSEDPNLPRTIQQESPQIRASWVDTFNSTLAKGGSEADAVHAANLLLPKRTGAKKDPKPTKLPKINEPAARKDMTMEPATAGRAMICLYLDPATAEMLAILPNVESAAEGIELEEPEDLHITLAYYPMVQPGERDFVIQRAAQIASNFSAPQTTISGIAQFFAGEDDPIPYVLLVDPRELLAMHESLCYFGGEPVPSRKHGYTPHITVAYVPRGASVQFTPPPVPPLRFSAVSVVFDNEDRHDFRFGGYGDIPLSVYRQRTGKVDEPGADGDPTASLQLLDVSQTRDEDKATETDTTMTDTTAPGLTGETEQSLEKAGRRVRSSWRDKLNDALDTLRGLASWADYEDEDEGDDEDGVKAVIKSFQEHPEFVVFKDVNGENRWLSFSSNGFEDREDEIISTAALTDVVERADKSGDRGELRLFHIKNTPIGDCDFQAIQGRFLVESGTFRDTELARKALEYFVSTDEKLGTSIGFQHPVDQFDGKVYHHVSRIVERSVCPHSMVANPWTAFTTLKGGPVDALKSSWLEKVAGKDLAATIISQADAATKTLEGSVSFKENTALTSALETVKGLVGDSGKEVQEAYASLLTAIVSAPAKEETKTVEAPPATGFDENALLAKITELVKPIADSAAAAAGSVETVANEVKALGDRMKSLEDDATAEKTRRSNEPRGAALFRATEASGNVVDGEKAQELLGSHEPPKSPVADYVKDLVAGRGVN